MSNLELITERRSIRRFTEQEIPDDVLAKLLETARWSPSWANSQCWEIVVVRGSEQKLKLKEALSDRNPASIVVENGPLVLAICGTLKRSGYYKEKAITILGDWFMYDLGIITQSLALAAHALGLGSVVVGAFDHARVKEILDLPEEVEVVSLLPVGYPDHSPSPPARREVSEFTHYEKYGS